MTGGPLQNSLGAPLAIGAAILPRPVLEGRHVVAICVGIVVGAGIFRTPSLVAANSGSASAFMLTWLLGGLLSMVGAMCYAELASTYPGPGGDYRYLQRAFGARLAFLYAWARLAVIQTGSLALLAFVFGDYLAQIFPVGPLGAPLYAAGVVVVLTLVNWLGVRQGGETQLWLTVVEVAGLVLVVMAGLLLAPSGMAAAAPATSTNLGLVMVFVLLTFGGWSEAVYVTAELRDARRRIAGLLVLSLAVVTALYLLVNLAYLRGLGLAGMAGSDALAADLLARAMGPPGVVLISLLVAIAALTSANATIITGARTTYALGRSFRALGWVGQWNTVRNSPGNALLVQGGVALLLVVAGAFTRDGFTAVVEYTAPVFWLFFLLVGIALFVLRQRDRDVHRPFRVPLYPVLPAVFCLTSAYLLYSSLAYTGRSALVGVVVLAIGGVLLFFFRPAPQEEIDA
jgi:APA family basic amino acid/polyamine antiporter